MPTKRFPNPPFQFHDDDKHLVEYLQREKIPYLSGATRRWIRKLRAGDDLDKQRRTLRNLWHSLLIDALRELKRHDRREYPSGAGIDFDSFFNKKMLGTDRLSEVFDAFEEFEALMYGARPDRYRDHFVHTFRVWAIGLGLLRACLRSSLWLSEKETPRGRPLAAHEWECAWAIAALCHDVGYPVTTLRHINDRTREALSPQGLQPAGSLEYEFSPRVHPLLETFITLMSSKIVPASSEPGPAGIRYLTHLQNKYYLKFLNSFDRRDHGVIGALVVGRSLVYFLESDLSQDQLDPLSADDAHQFLIRREILRAIAAHTCPEIYHLRFDTLAFLLFIVDELQMWGRATFDQLASRTLASKATVTIREFGPQAIYICVASERPWSEEKKAVEDQFDKIRKRIRLAVDTPVMKELKFWFSVESGQDDRGLAIELANGAIHLRKLPQ